jgi:GrpB-like predicted nucleotidyltransferase (UPF0157 family)
MPVCLVDYDPAWSGRFANEAAAIRAALGADALAVEHIGSTAMPGMRAKPVIDIMVLIDDIEDAPAYIKRLRPLDYHYYPYSLDRTPERRWFCKPGLENRTHHLHLVQAGTEFHREHLLFRDYLVCHADVAADYLALKESLAARFPDDREAYTEGKTEFIRAVLSRAVGAEWSTE